MRLRVISGGILMIFCLAGSLIFARPGGERKAKYIGAEMCISCHRADSLGNQFRRWLGTSHSRSWVMLQGKEAKKLAREMGIEDPQKSPLCLKCHAPAFRDTSLWCKTFHPEDGVQCEACHGPGSIHAEFMRKQMEVGKGKMSEEAMLPKPSGGEKFCLTCHQRAPHPMGEFCYKKAWKRICHPLPKGK